MTLAKPLAGGLPIGAVLVTEAVASTIANGDHGSTFAGGPLVCHAALAVFDHIQVYSGSLTHNLLPVIWILERKSFNLKVIACLCWHKHHILPEYSQIWC
jgi:hypothetical protein